MELSPIPFPTAGPVSAADDEATRPALSVPKLTVLGAEATQLESLVQHRESVEAGTPLETALRVFRDRRVDFMAVLRDERVIGLCARGQIGFVMGSRFGFALYSQNPVETELVKNPLIVSRDTPVRELLDRAMARQNDAFREEVVLVDNEQRLLGLIPVETLAQLQSRLVAEQLDELRRQQAALLEQNLELFRTNHALRQSQGLYLGLFESHTLGVALLDVQGGIHEHNKRLAELLGFGDAQASLVSLTAWVTETDRPTFLALLEAHATNGAAATTREFVFYLPGRGARLFRCSTGWIRETGQICACLDDITDQRALERNMLRREKQMLLDTLVGGIAHELNNKLTPVQGFAELLTHENDAATARTFTNLIQQSVGEAAVIVKQLLQLAKPVAPMAQTVDLRVIIEEAMAMLRFKLRENPCEVRMALVATPVWVMAEAGQLKQVIINLILNALQAMEGCSKRVLTIEVQRRETERLAALSVTDSGCGITAENIGRIFDPFFTTKGPVHGTGLGLSICFSIVRQHGGEIAVESQPGQGTRFNITLPLEDGSRVLFGQSTEPAATTSRPANASLGKRVLVVEDEEVVRRLLQEMLRTQFGCRVDLANNGEEALNAFVKEDYALVLSDIRMSVMSGPELFLHLRELRPEISRRFIFLTGYPGDRPVEDEIAQWNVPIIPKPFSLIQLTEVCAPFLRGAPELDLTKKLEKSALF